MRTGKKTKWILSVVTSIILLLPTAALAESPPPSLEKSAVSKNPLVEQKVAATLWLKSAEGRALSYQAFNLAKMMFDKALAENEKHEKLAVIVDIDDTIIDTSGYTVDVIMGLEASGAAWTNWVQSQAATPLPGSVEFLNYVVEKGGDVFYVTNRLPDIKEATLKSLATLGFPQAEYGHLFIREQGMASSKESRRQEVAKNHKIALLMGDNLEDFSDLFAPVNVKSRAEAVDQAKDLFGTKFIVLPNPMYGDWEKAIVENKKDLSIEVTRELKIKALTGKD
ncbi:5'-nucleotidase, lipoprotein e(P4) family [Brevibacillus ruminantium]|uniref:5'-nucleotidase, lipoprotein e(P4) family n=1 Tax=Brevibacillus ruminantium TaxID=2950604 RepID=A0ABY4WCX7_9BACL|nr:5'-nucleotidase, lipoprotein e(P4) family [Brevibacillus ruminantium]USG65031.1 5'-nucleotidase, lipoprotein e(P4) family [Brevibacillus ruminantium]